MSTLRFYTDTHINKQVALQLRAKGIDVTRCEEVGLGEADDETHLIYASSHKCALITKDEGFRVRHFEWIRDKKTHSGIFFCGDRNSASVGTIVKACLAYAALIDEEAGTLEDIRNEFFDIC